MLILDSSWARSFEYTKVLSCMICQVISARSINKKRFKHHISYLKYLKMTSNDLEMTHFRTKIRWFPIMYRKSDWKMSDLRAQKGVPSDHNIFLCHSFKSSWSFGTSDTTAAYAPSTTCFGCIEYHYYSIASFGMKTSFYIIDFLYIYIIISTIKRLNLLNSGCKSLTNQTLTTGSRDGHSCKLFVCF